MNILKIKQNFFCLVQWSQKDDIWTFSARMNWVREKWLKQCFDMMRKFLETRKLKKEVNVMRLIKSRKITWHIENVKWRESKNWECMTLMSSMMSMTHVKHVKYSTLRMYLRIYKHDHYSAEKNFLLFFSCVSSKYWNYISTIDWRNLHFKSYLFAIFLYFFCFNTSSCFW